MERAAIRQAGFATMDGACWSASHRPRSTCGGKSRSRGIQKTRELWKTGIRPGLGAVFQPAMLKQRSSSLLASYDVGIVIGYPFMAVRQLSRASGITFLS